jgi:diphthine-ammonia ligase
MCGIFGVIGKNAKTLTEQGIEVLKSRGKDGTGFYHEPGLCLGHALHSVVGLVKQPLVGKVAMVSNNEIYNWQEIAKHHKFKAKNDSEALFKLLRMKSVSPETLDGLDGTFAFAFLEKKTLYLARDILGIKPLWFSHSDGFSFSSEKKALEAIGKGTIAELNPRKILKYDIASDTIEWIDRPFFSIEKPWTSAVGTITKKTRTFLQQAIRKRIPDQKYAILFSGGIDSTYIAYTLKRMGESFTCYTCVLDDPAKKEPEDLYYAKRIAKDLNLDHKIIRIKPRDIPTHLKKIVPMIEDSNVVKAEVALTFHAAAVQAAKDGCKVIFSGLGSEEIFAGYQRHKDSQDINKECVSGLLKLYERDLYRDDVITMHNGIEGRFPFLDKALVTYALRIPGEFKIRNRVEKYILRRIAKDDGLPKEYADRKKRAAQYGSNFSKAISTLTKQNGFKYKSEYLQTFYRQHNLNLGALVSSGKDSIFAMHVMLRQNYKIGCMITIKSKNLDSYMFHTPTIELVKMQSKATGIPLLTASTKGDKEEELKDLKKALKKAKEQFRIDGIITGALYSTYQRDRIEKICDELQLKIFSPLWHINQETEMREILDNGYEFILTKVAAEGLNKSWLGKTITKKDVDKLVALNEKIGLNVAGEGGEFESLMIDGPIFKERIAIHEATIAEEAENCATLIITHAELEKKS